MPIYSLARAATEARRSRSTLLRALQTGRLSGVRDPVSGMWSIDASELRRAYPRVSNGHDAGHVGTAPVDMADSAALIAAKDALINEQRAVIDDLRRRLDRADERLTALLADQRPPIRRWWRFGR